MNETVEKTEKTILIYGLTEQEFRQLCENAEQEGVCCKAITDACTHLTISQLLSGIEYPAGEEKPLVGKYALLEGFEGQVELGTSLINQVTSGVIKAVHTKHNTNWKFHDLCSAIYEEHQYMMQMRRKKQQQQQ